MPARRHRRGGRSPDSIVNATVIPLADAPRGYHEFDEGAARKYVLDPNSVLMQRHVANAYLAGPSHLNAVSSSEIRENFIYDGCLRSNVRLDETYIDRASRSLAVRPGCRDGLRGDRNRSGDIYPGSIM